MHRKYLTFNKYFYLDKFKIDLSIGIDQWINMATMLSTRLNRRYGWLFPEWMV